MRIILLALRSLTRSCLDTIINILGLVLSLMCVVIIQRGREFGMKKVFGAVGVSLFTLIWQVQKAASTNPTEAIKTE